MKKLLLPLVAAAALAAPASAFSWGGGHDHHGDSHVGFAGITKLSGTGTSFGGTSASVTGSNFSVTLSTTWSSASAKTFMNTTFSCAPATALLTVGGTSTSFTGKTCSLARNDATRYVFTGKASDAPRLVLGENGTTVEGAVFKGRLADERMTAFAQGHSGNCDHH
jgi:hypothetical protein